MLQSMLSPRVGGRAYIPRGIWHFGQFSCQILYPGGKDWCQIPLPLGYILFDFGWYIIRPSLSFNRLVISHTLYRGVSPQIKCRLKLFSPTRTNIQQLTGNWTHMRTNQLPETAIPRKLFGQCFQDGRLRLGSRLLSLVKLTHPQDLVLHQIFYSSPPMGKEIQSNAPGMPPTPTLGLNINWCIPVWQSLQRRLWVHIRCHFLFCGQKSMWGS